MPKIRSRFFKIYYIILILWAIFGLIDSTVLSGSKEKIGQVGELYLYLSSLFMLLVFILSIVSLINFIRKKYPKITIIMPIYSITILIITVLIGFVYGILLVVQGKDISTQTIPSILSTIGIMSSVAEILFCSYILHKYTNITQKF